jgi:hypothetical protein
MDHTRILNEICSRKVLDQAFGYALHDRTGTDFYFDYLEIEYARVNRDSILDEIVQELRTPKDFEPRLAYAYFPPKTALCYRRMVYLPFKDLVVRYAFCIVFSRLLDARMSPASFANRRASGGQAARSFLQDFSRTSWPNFCEWQRKQAESSGILAKTDISAYYDSISHHYLSDAIIEELALSPRCNLMKLFEKLLAVRVVAYSQETGKIKIDQIHQGLPIGNGTEGFFANIYLNRVDGVMGGLGASESVFFGRYNDDMRIFGSTRRSVLNAVRLLQELLLVKGLNLNASKTKLAEDKAAIEGLISQDYEVYEYFEEEDRNEREVHIGPPAVSDVNDQLDRHFHEFNETFAPGQELSNDAEAKDFCKFLSARGAGGTRLLGLSRRMPEHMEMLGKVLMIWHGSGKHAAWLLSESAFYRGVSVPTRAKARELIFTLLEMESVSSYVRYRLLHHLVRMRQKKNGKTFRFLDYLSSDEKTRLKGLIPRFCHEPAFELNMVAIYISRCLGTSLEEVGALIKSSARDPNAEPFINAISYITSSPLSISSAAIPLYDEPAEIQAPY